MRFVTLSRALALGAVTAGAALAQDECATAAAVGLGATPFDTTTATVSPELFPCGGSSNTALDLWFTFTPGAVGSQITVDTFGSAFDTRLQILEGTCGALTSIGCNDDFGGLQSQLIVNASSLSPIYIRVAGYNAGSGVGTLNIAELLLPNDECSGATALAAGATPFDSTLASTSVEPFGCAPVGADLWYAYTSTGIGNLVTIETCGSTFDTVLEVYTGGCGMLAPEACDDDTCGLQSSVSFVTPAIGTSYLVRVGGFAGDFGPGTLTVSELPPPPMFDLAFTDCLPGTFIDISGTGTPLNIADDGVADITTTVSNALLGAGLVRVGSNGGVGFAGATASLSFSNAQLPGTGFGGGQALFPFWDDFDTESGLWGNILWEEVGGTLIVQWDNASFFNGSAVQDRATLQLQVPSSGPALAQFLYTDIESLRASGGSSATIGYKAGGIGNDVQYSFNAHYAVRNGAVLSLVNKLDASVLMTDGIAGTFTDISGTGTPLGLTDDGEVDVPTTVGNSLLAAGVARVGSNGGIRFAGAGTELGFTNGAIPSSAAFSATSQALLPFWDDFNTQSGAAGNIYWQEIGDTLIVQWNMAGFFGGSAGDDATFQVKVFGSGPVAAQYIYQSVEGVRAAMGGSATVGYQAGGVGNDVQWSFNSPVITNGLVLSICHVGGTVGTPYCIPVANSTGVPARMFGTGSASLATNDLVLNVADLPLNSFGYFVRGTASAYTLLAGGGQGTLCVGGTTARGVGGAIVNSGATGALSLPALLTALPSSTGPVSATVGQTLWLQYWFRDVVGGVATSNLSNALQVKVKP